MVQIKTFTNLSLQIIEKDINFWLEKQITAGHFYTIKEIKIYPTEDHYFAYIIYDDNTIPATFVDKSTAEMWF